MGDLITLTIDGREVSVQPGVLVVDAAKLLDIDIPVFCYHPKMEPVGMCRMCLVEIGRPMMDRATGQALLNEDGTPRIQFAPKLETACTTPVSQGMVVNGMSKKVQEARKDVIEFLLTSHPLDCPICDKGGECPLQNLTIAYGPGQSRFLYEEKMHLAKHHPLGELIVLDRERCIQCGRCVRFQAEIVDDPVIGFSQRGRGLEIVTYSDPGFDSYFSGNTTDICPVGALTSTDFRFRARPWELNTAASICPHCPVGCNINLNVRREAHSGGDTVIKRIMPRQNEWVNEIWICDKGRYGYHYTMDPERLTQPLVRRNGELVSASWEEALQLVADQLKAAGSNLVTLAGGRLSNEDLFNLHQLTEHQGGKSLLHTHMGGGDLVAQYGLHPDSNLKDLGKGDAVLVVACDLEEEAPVWWLRIKQVAERGATLIVANSRHTKLDRAATHQLRYTYGSEVELIQALMPGQVPVMGSLAAGTTIAQAAADFANAQNAIIIFGQDGNGLAGSQAIAQAAADLLAATGHVGRVNNGLLGAWSVGNTQGAWEIGFRPSRDLYLDLQRASVAYVIAADPVGDDPNMANAFRKTAFLVVEELFLSETARLADVVLPALPFTDRDGTFTNGERRVQRFYPGVPSRSQARPDYAITALLAAQLGLELESGSAQQVFIQLAGKVPAFSGLTYDRLSQVVDQWPMIGRSDLYYGGTSYGNHQGIGVRLAPASPGSPTDLPPSKKARHVPEPGAGSEEGALVAVPITRLYDRSQTLLPSVILHQRLTPPLIGLHPNEASRQGLVPGELAQSTINGVTAQAQVLVDESLPEGYVVVPRSVGLPITEPTSIQIEKIEVPVS